jgi:ABC-type sugar transport system substrate-binding protein
MGSNGREIRRGFTRQLIYALVGVLVLGSFAAGTSSAAGRLSAHAFQSAGLYLGHPSKKQCAGKHYTIGYDVFSDTEDFAVAFTNDQQKVANNMGCVTIVKLVDNADTNTAINNTKIFIQRHVDGVILFQVISAAQPGIMALLNTAKIPAIATAVSAPGAPFVDENDFKTGTLGGIALGKAFKKKHPGQVPYEVIGAFPEGGPVSVARMKGVENGVKKAINIPSNHVFEVDTKADPPTAQARTLDVLGRIPKGATILMSGINDQNTYAMFQAAKQARRANNVLIMGMGGVLPLGLQFVCQNKQYVGAVAFFPDTWGKWTVPAIIDSIQGKKLPANIYIPTKVLTRSNMKKYYANAPC